MRDNSPHVKLFIPGPTEVLPEVLDAQGGWMIGHRMPECLDLIGRIRPKLRAVFLTEKRVLIAQNTGTGLMEAALLNTVNKKVLNCVNGAFSTRWAEIAVAVGKEQETLEVEWGEAVMPEMVAERLADGSFDAICITHNETSTGVTNPLPELVKAVRNAPNGDEIMILVDAVSSLSGVRIPFEEWDLDVLLTSSQKAFALPAGISFAAVSDRAMAKAATVPNRGYYFDFLTLEKYLLKNQTPATTAVSLLNALDYQLDRIMEEGVQARFDRHLAMRDRTLEWGISRGFEPIAAEGFRSPTVTSFHNTLNIDIPALNDFLRTKGMFLSNGYGSKLKNISFRIAHMGDMQMEDMEELFTAVDEFIETQE